jgi:hypothetical protein
MPESPQEKLRPPPEPPEETFCPATVDYAELDVTTNFSFLRGASHPDELVLQAARLGHRAIAITDLNTLAGAVRMFDAARQIAKTGWGPKLIIGTRLAFDRRARRARLGAGSRGVRAALPVAHARPTPRAQGRVSSLAERLPRTQRRVARGARTVAGAVPGNGQRDQTAARRARPRPVFARHHERLRRRRGDAPAEFSFARKTL